MLKNSSITRDYNHWNSSDEEHLNIRLFWQNKVNTPLSNPQELKRSYFMKGHQNNIIPDRPTTSIFFSDTSQHFFKVYNYVSLKQDGFASAYIAVLIHHALRNNEFDFIKKIFIEFEKQHLTSWPLIALLRSTSLYKNEIPLWKDYYLFTRRVVIKEGKNYEQELYGLDRGLFLEEEHV